MKSQLKPGVLLVLLSCAVFLLSGCHDKKKKPSVPDQAQAPTVAPPNTTTDPQPAAEDESKPATPAKRPKPRPAKPAPKAANDKDKPVVVAENAPPKIIIQEGPAGATASPPATTAPLTDHTEAAHNRATTDQLLDSTEANLRIIKRQLSSEEQATMAQVLDFVTQSRRALKDNDQVSARKLAMKAHLLSDELAKPK